MSHTELNELQFVLFLLGAHLSTRWRHNNKIINTGTWPWKCSHNHIWQTLSKGLQFCSKVLAKLFTPLGMHYQLKYCFHMKPKSESFQIRYHTWRLYKGKFEKYRIKGWKWPKSGQILWKKINCYELTLLKIHTKNLNHIKMYAFPIKLGHMNSEKYTFMGIYSETFD